ncbi:MAG: hypothetical protein LBC53_06935 [Spirochaetaceae bacterium]|jgi:hypothetical protein|nr:hypothetical protein [Spirochaetaceae bacterium]
MKKILFLAFLAFTAVFTAGAQGAGAEIVSVTGTLGLSAGRIVIKSGGETYYAKGIGRYVGFIDGLKSGAEATIEGYIFPSFADAAGKNLIPVKLKINGNVYEVGSESLYADGGRHLGGRRQDFNHGPARRGRW